MDRADSVTEAVQQMTCLHATEPASVYLSAFARTEATRPDIDRAIYDDRTVVKQLAMRRTLFLFPRELLPATWGSASARVAGQLRTRLAKEVESNGLAERGEGWVTRMFADVLLALERDGPATTAQLRERLPLLAQRLELAPGKSYGGSFPIAPRLLGTLAATGSILRGAPEGEWRSPRPRWTLTDQWLGESPEQQVESAEGYAVLVGRWLRSFGPGTEADLVWWFGATKAAVRRALADLGAVEVAVASAAVDPASDLAGQTGGESVGYLLPDDLEDVAEPEPWAALLPVLDPTTMGWKQRGFYLTPDDVPHLFDSNGNAGTTAWWDGRVVGCWVQDPDGIVSVVLRHDIGAEGVRALDAQASRLTRWLDGARVGTVYPSALMKAAPAAATRRPG